MRTFTLVFLFLLGFSFTSCFPELTEEEIIIVDEAEEAEPDSEPDSEEVGNFKFSFGSYQLDHAYITTYPYEYADKEVHQIIISRDDVAIDDQTLVGLSPALTLSIVSPKGSLEGLYSIGSADFGTDYSASRADFYNRLRFERDNNVPSAIFENGALLITKEEGEYHLTFDFGGQGTPETGEITTSLRTISFPQPELPTEADFQGNNVFTRDNVTINLRYAYLVREGESYSGKRKYTLYLTEHEIMEAGELTGISTALMLKAYGDLAHYSGTYGSGASSTTFLEDLSPTMQRTLYCTNFNFTTGRFDTDEETEGETLVLRQGGEIMVRFNGTIRGTNILAEGLYRGPLVVLD